MLHILLLAVMGFALAPEGEPGSRSAHAMTYHPDLRQVVLIGGKQAGVDAGIWGWNGSDWEHHGSDAGPDGRGHFALASDGERLLLHGGLFLRFGEDIGEDDRKGDMWAWADGSWSRVHGADDGPGVRDHHAMAYDDARKQLVLFGGSRTIGDSNTTLGDTWILDGGAWTRHKGTGPPPRSTHRLVYDAHREVVVLFGGWGEDGLLQDTWEWDGASWTLASTDGPSPRFATRMAYDASARQVVLFGGRGVDGDLADTWTWDGESWNRVEAAGPSARNVHGMAYDAHRGHVVLYGGFSGGNRFVDTWLWDGSVWKQAE